MAESPDTTSEDLADDLQDSGRFEFVKKRKSNRRKVQQHPLQINRDNENTLDIKDKSTAVRRILTAKTDILQSDYYCSFQATLREAFEVIGNPQIKEIICYGLGKFTELMSSRYQLAFLICLKEQFDTVTFVYDPLFYTIEKEILEDLGFILITINEEGKRKILADTPTLLYFPHCPNQLVNNFLSANWSPKNLKECILIGNSFSNILESTPKTFYTEIGEYIINISPYVDEFYTINTFKYTDFFNDTSIHIFQEDKLRLIDPDFWTKLSEPKYNPDTLTIILNKTKIS